MRFKMSAIGLVCATMLSACGGGGGGGGGLVQSISFAFPGGATVGAPPEVATVALKATASSGGPVTFASDTPTICSVSGSTLSLLKSGECAVTASQAGFEGYAPVSQRQLFVVPKRPQMIAFRNQGAQPLDAQPVALSASSTSGAAVTFSTKTPAVCSVSGNSLTKLADGLCTVVAAQESGNDFYLPGALSRDIPIGTAKAPALTFLSGYMEYKNGETFTTRERGVVETDFKNVWWCPDCSRSTPSDGSSFTFTASSETPPPAGWASSRARFWIHAANLAILDTTGHTLTGVRIDAQAALKFNLGQNAEWVSTGKNGVNIELFLGHFNLKDGKDACNVTLKATVTPTAAAATDYSVGLKDGFTIGETCGLSGLDLWTELQDYPISKIMFSAVEPNGTVKTTGANYQSQYTLTGAITFQ